MSAPGHPTPWRWETIGDVFSLRDARGVRILLGDEVGGVGADDPVAGALIVSAPEMETSLRWAIDTIRGFIEDVGAWPAAAMGADDSDPESTFNDAVTLLQRLDKARKAGG